MGNQLGKLSQEVDAGRSNGIDSRNLVKQVGQPHELGVERHVHTPNRVVHQLATDRYLITNGFFAVVHHSGTNVEILVDGIIQVQTQQSLALHAEGGLVFQRHADVGARIDDTLVSDGHRTHGVIHRIVAVLGQGHTSGGYHNRSACHVGGIELDDATRTGLVLTRKDKLVFVTELLSHGER